MRIRTSFLCAFPLLIGIVGCSGKVVTVDDLAGTWVITEQSKTVLPVDSRKGAGKLLLRGNGEFIAEEVPGELLYSPPGVNDTVPTSGAGSWEIRKVDGSPALLLTFKAFSRPSGRTAPTAAHILIDNDWRDTVLYFFTGDPDQGGRIDFEKMK